MCLLYFMGDIKDFFSVKSENLIPIQKVGYHMKSREIIAWKTKFVAVSSFRTCAPGGLRTLRVLLVIVGLQNVSVFGHHEDGDEVNNSKSQKLSLLTVLLKQTRYTKRPAAVRRPPFSEAVASEWCC